MIRRSLPEASRAGFWPEALKMRYLQFSGGANRLRGPHSNDCLLPSGSSTTMLPLPSST